MGIRKWDPLRDLLALQESMNRLFEDSLVRSRPEASGPGRGWVPPADVYETDTAFVVSLDLPGVTQEDVEVRVDGGELLLRGERRLASVRPESFERMERSYGPFCRSFAFPEEVDPARVTAQFRDGLLRLELPKARSGASRRRREGGEEA